MRKKILMFVLMVCLIMPCMFLLSACGAKDNLKDFTVAYDKTYEKIFDDLSSVSLNKGEAIVSMPQVDSFYEGVFLGWYIQGFDKKLEYGDKIEGNVVLEPRFSEKPSGLYYNNIMTMTWQQLIIEDITFDLNGTTLNHVDAGLVGDLVLDDSVCEIGEGACVYTNLDSIFIPNTVFSIDSGAFANSFIKSISFEQNSKLNYVGVGAFRNSKIQSINFPASVTYLGSQAFMDSDIQEVSFDIGSNLTTLQTIFYNCPSLKIVNIPSSIESIFDFLECPSLRCFNVDPENQFYSSKNGILFSKDMSVLVRYPAGQDLYYEISSSVSVIGHHAFSDCRFTSIDIPENVNTVESLAFENCSNLRYVTISKNIQEIGDDIFRFCTELENIYVDPENTSFRSEDGVLYTNDLKTLVVYPQGKSDTLYSISSETTALSSTAFSGCNNLKLKDLIIPSSITKGIAYLGNIVVNNSINIINIYYVGEKNMWQNLGGVSLNNIDNLKVYYYSETQPTEEGNYWYYDTDGVTPVIWETE